MITLTCSLCSLIPQSLSLSWMLDLCCLSVQLANFTLGLPISRIAGVIVGLILLVNARSLPLICYINMLLPFGILRCKYRMLAFYHKITLQPAVARHRTVVAQLESCCPVGANPFEFTTTVKSWASLDETDLLGHVNNSNYAKARDVALSKFGVATWPTFVNAGGWVVLGSTYFHFLCEIPRFATYEMNLSIGAWDHKWLYLICRFTSPRRAKGSSGSTRSKVPIVETRSTPSESESGRSSDDDTVPMAQEASETNTDDGTTLHCFTISRVCFKIGRITVPPAIVLASEGFSKPPKTGSYSRELPPPHWVYPHSLRVASDSLDTYRQFLTGGWRKVKDEDRWWIEPLSGEIEERRKANLSKLEVIDRAVVTCRDIS